MRAARSDFPVSAAYTDLQDAKLRARYRYGLKQIGVFAIALGWDIGPRALLAGRFADPICVVSATRE